jgi:acyl-CoA synthetase (AMP-forming)/AMP-acid ligase II
MSENRWEFIAVILGLAKIGVTVAMINNNLCEALLQHALDIANTRHVIVSTKSLSSVMQLDASTHHASPRTLWHLAHGSANAPSKHCDATVGPCDFAHAIEQHSTARPDRHHRDRVRPRDAMFYIYTSGTTGKSKAAKFSNKRWIGAGVCWSGPSLLSTSDKYYISLPLFHGYVASQRRAIELAFMHQHTNRHWPISCCATSNAMAVALSPCLFSGSTAVIREKFSASNFVSDLCKYQVGLGGLDRMQRDAMQC